MNSATTLGGRPPTKDESAGKLPPHGRLRRVGIGEPTIAMVLVALFASTALLCANRNCPHADEVMYAETSANIAAGLGAIANTHANVVPGDPIAVVYVPYVYSHAAWIGALGLSRLTVQSFNIVLVAGAMVASWLYLRRSQAVRTPGLRLFLVGTAPLLPSVLALYWTNRYDVVALLGMCTALLATTIPDARWRLTVLVVAGALVGGDGFHPAIIAPILAAILWLSLGRRHAADYCVFITGVALGLAITFGEMAWNGTIDNFRLLMQHNSVQARSLYAILTAPFKIHATIRDNAIITLSLIVALFSSQALVRKMPWSQPSLIGLGISATVPIILTTAGRYNHTYAWLAVVPMYVCACLAMQQDLMPRAARWVVIALLTIDAFSGLPLRALAYGIEFDRNSYDVPYRLIADQIRPDDIGFASYTAYYPVKSTANEAYFGAAIHSMTADQARAVTVAVLADDKKPRGMFELGQNDVLRKLGGEWQETSRIQVPRGQWRQLVPPAPRETFVFDFRVFRRVK